MKIGERTGCGETVKRRSRVVIAQFYSSRSSPSLEMDRLTDFQDLANKSAAGEGTCR